MDGAYTHDPVDGKFADFNDTWLSWSRSLINLENSAEKHDVGIAKLELDAMALAKKVVPIFQLFEQVETIWLLYYFCWKLNMT